MKDICSDFVVYTIVSDYMFLHKFFLFALTLVIREASMRYILFYFFPTDFCLITKCFCFCLLFNFFHKKEKGYKLFKCAAGKKLRVFQ